MTSFQDAAAAPMAVSVPSTVAVAPALIASPAQDEYEGWYNEQGFGGEPGGGDDDGPLWGLLDTTDDDQITEDEWFTEEGFSELDDDDSGVFDEDEFGV